MSDSELSKLRHDLRGCLNAIQLSVQVLKFSAAPHDVIQFVAHIEREVVRAALLLQSSAARPAEAASGPAG